MNCTGPVRTFSAPLRCLKLAAHRNPIFPLTMLMVSAALFAPQARAQCYQFNGSAAQAFALSIAHLPTPTTMPYGSGTQYSYTFSTAMTGNTLIYTSSGTVQTSTSFSGSIIVESSPSGPTGSNASMTFVDSHGAFFIFLTLESPDGTLFSSGLPAVFPGMSNWTGLNSFNSGEVVSINSACSLPPPDKTIGYCAVCNGEGGGAPPGQPSGFEPITISTGNVFESKTDYMTAGANPLSFTRSYNSMYSANPSFAGTMGNWRTPYDRYLHISPSGSPTTVIAERADGRMLTFTGSGSTWTTDSDVDYTLTHSGSTWTLTDHNDTVETYHDAGTGEGLLETIALRNGYTQTLTYSSGLVSSVTDSYSRAFNFTYTGGLLTNVTNPDSGTGISYGYNSNNALTTVTYPTSPSTTLTYVYGNTMLPLALTGITDENGNTYATWGYDSSGRAISNQMGGSLAANAGTLSYGSGTTTVTNAFGVADTYTFTTLQNVPKVTGISRAATSTTAAATESFAYDSNGFLNSVTDWNGNQTSYTNNSHGDPTAINEAVGSSVARTTTISYDTTWVRLPHQTVTPGLTSTFAYDSHGNALTRTDLDTTTNTVPYSTNGQSRVTTWTWSSTGQMASVQLPRTDVTAKTSFTYTGGTLTQISDALSHTTNITSYTGGGQPLTVVDINGVTTTLTYDGRQNLATSTYHTTVGNLVTTWTRDAALNLTALQLPNNAKTTYSYDNAHRLTGTSDLLTNSIAYALDQLGDRTSIKAYYLGTTATYQDTPSYDALGRMTKDTDGGSNVTNYTFDPDGNMLTVAPPSPSGTVTYAYDALNRLSTRTDPSSTGSGVTTTAYDAHNRALSVQDPNGNTTAYVYNGFGDRTQLASPDSGTTVAYFNPDRDMTQEIKPGPLTKNMTYDALDRMLTKTFPSDTTLNVAYTYDQTGSGYGFGIGRLTSVSDQPGTDGYNYDERGNITFEYRSLTSTGLQVTTTAYDAASRPASERLEAVAELSLIAYRLKHGGGEPPPFNKTAVRFLPFPEGLNDPAL